METKELKIQVPEGYEIDKENSTFECIKFNPIKKDITYEKICKELLFNKPSFYISDRGEVRKSILRQQAIDKNNATNEEQLERILALNELFNIAEYYNQMHAKEDYKQYYIVYHVTIGYKVYCYDEGAIPGMVVTFDKREDAQAVIDNPNFREILDTIYKKSLSQFMNENRRDSD